MDSKKLKVAILGSGFIGTDLLIKILRSKYLDCTLFVGRNLQSSGMSKAVSLGVAVSDRSIEAIAENPKNFELVFDATSAHFHQIHAPILKKLGIIAIDMTPAQVGGMCIPAVNLKECLDKDNVNMVTCGGQASTPIAYAIGQVHKDVDYIEVISTIASRSAGPATRANMDEYIETTEKAVKVFSGAKKTKAVLVLNPAQPCINMQTTVFAKISKPDMVAINIAVDDIVKKMQKYVPGYSLVISPTYENNRVITMVRVQGAGDYLPSYAGNLDIINCAAIATAEEYAKRKYGIQEY
ncbi:MAG: acetaldehyde dehydrogenase (acetylating) [Elusimicrobia bacterium]|nr:acetaldehyde dehydrogenase (acetylating) [Elusimicrobiota bacterium]